jgi:hypothetical protein
MERLANAIRSNKTPGAAWVTRFLQPLLAQHFSNNGAISCLQLAAGDPTEAEQLVALGHRCELIEASSSLKLTAPDATYDFAFTGRFPLLADETKDRVVLARELHRVLRPGGALLLVFGNLLCPIDLTRNGPLLHLPGARQCLRLSEVLKIFISQAGFESLKPLSVCGHYGWNQLPGSLRWAGKLMDAYWRWLAVPSRNWFYFGPLNPTLALWLNKP